MLDPTVLLVSLKRIRLLFFCEDGPHYFGQPGSTLVFERKFDPLPAFTHSITFSIFLVSDFFFTLSAYRSGSVSTGGAGGMDNFPRFVSNAIPCDWSILRFFLAIVLTPNQVVG